MYAYREYLIKAACPYCGKDFESITYQRETDFVKRCDSCSRGLTVVTTKDLLAIVERGLPVQKVYAVDPLTKDCCQ